MPLVRIDETFVKHLQNVRLDVAQAEAGSLFRHLAHQFRPGRRLQRPVEEIRLHGTDDPLVRQRPTGQQGRRIIDRQVQYAGGDRLDDDREIGVL